MGALLGGTFFRLKGDSLIHEYCDTQRCDLEAQTRLVLGGSA
jgi:hypothetical protein